MSSAFCPLSFTLCEGKECRNRGTCLNAYAEIYGCPSSPLYKIVFLGNEPVSAPVVFLAGDSWWNWAESSYFHSLPGSWADALLAVSAASCGFAQWVYAYKQLGLHVKSSVFVRPQKKAWAEYCAEQYEAKKDTFSMPEWLLVNQGARRIERFITAEQEPILRNIWISFIQHWPVE